MLIRRSKFHHIIYLVKNISLRSFQYAASFLQLHPRYRLIWFFLIRLRFVRKNQSLDDVIIDQHRLIEPERMPSGYIKSVLKNKTSIRMLDGYDEYTPGTNKDIDKVIESGIGNCFLILTSRPGDYLEKEIRDQMDGEIIIEGVSVQQIWECSNRYLKMRHWLKKC